MEPKQWGGGPVSFPLGMKPDEYGLTGRRGINAD